MRHLLSDKILFLFLFSCSFFSLTAQAPKTNFKEIAEQLQMTEYAADTAAAAVILSDYGEASIEERSGGLILQYTMYRRVKIFNESAFDLTEVEIQHHASGGQKVTNVKGETFYMEGNKLKSVKLSKKDVLHEKLEDGVEVVKFTLPQVKEGAVFEYSYMLSSESYSHIRPWYFQKYYPVAHSEYITRIPEWFRFLPLFKGGMPLTSNESSSYKGNINIISRSDRTKPGLRNSGGQSTVTTQSLSYQGQETTYIMEQVPGFVKEPFMTTASDHIASLEFQLQTVQFPQRPVESVLSSWENLAKQYLEWTSFGDRLKDGKIKRLVKDLPLAGKSTDEQVVLIYEFVRGSMTWDGDYSDVVSEPLHTAWEQKIGSSGAINLILLTMLREAGVEAFPVITSTRNHGKVQRLYPLASQFNHVIVLAAMSEGEVLLDGTSDYTAFGMLPQNVLNGQGFLVDDKQPDWVSLQARHKQDMTIMANLSLDAEGNLVGKFSHSCKGYHAADSRYRLNKLEKDEKEFANTYMMNDWADAQIESVEVKHYEERNSPIVIACEFTSSDYVNAVGDFIYIQPMLSAAQSENPFKLKERSYPVDFAAPIHEQYIFNLALPEGYVVDELPEATRIALPNKGGTFSYQVQSMGNMLQLVSDLSITQQVFSPQEYGNIKAFFEYIVGKHAEQIVLKKSE